MKPRDPMILLAEALAAVLVAIRRAAEPRADEWVDQARSPLGRRTHCRMVRQGKIHGSKVAGRVLVRRRDLDAFIEAHMQPVATAALVDERAEAEAALQKALQRPSRRRRRP